MLRSYLKEERAWATTLETYYNVWV
jgi:hypothetical protein